MAKKFNLNQVTGKQWLFAVAVLILFVYLNQGGTSTLSATECPDGDASCKLKVGLYEPVKDWILNNPLFALGVLAFAVFFVWSQDLFKRKGD